MKRLLAFMSLIMVTVSLWAEERSQLQNALMRIEVTFQESSSYTPWRWKSSQTRSGQGLVVGDDLVLVMATLVLNATHIEGRLNAEPFPTTLQVAHLDLDRGIALLKGALPLDSRPYVLPKASSLKKGAPVVMTWKTNEGRFMEGHGTLDRMESLTASGSYQKQAYFQASNVSVRGGYGEPVFCEGVLIGFGAQSVGGGELSILPVEMVHLRYDLPSGNVKPDTAMSGVVTKPCLQKHLREMKGLKHIQGGCLVAHVFEQGSGSKLLKKGDVLLSFNGKELDAWGRYHDPEWGTLDWEVLLGQQGLNESTTCTILRDGKRLNLELQLSKINEDDWLIPAYRLGQRSQYFVRGGFVFQDLSMSYVKAWGADWKKKAPDSILRILESKKGLVKEEQQDIVLLSKVLAHPVNRGFQNMGRQVVHKINGEKLLSIRQLKDVMDDATGTVELAIGDDELPLMLDPVALRSADLDVQKWYQVQSPSHLR